MQYCTQLRLSRCRRDAADVRRERRLLRLPRSRPEARPDRLGQAPRQMLVELVDDVPLGRATTTS